VIEMPPEASPGRRETAPSSLNAIELALIAELSLEQARAHDEVANDPVVAPETRARAAQAAAAWRERGRSFQWQAQQLTAQPITPDGLSPSPIYTGPERRRGMRRTQTRRTDSAAESGSGGHRDRRFGSDRRQSDRRAAAWVALERGAIRG
jgi:hypothetical protein